LEILGYFLTEDTSEVKTLESYSITYLWLRNAMGQKKAMKITEVAQKF
jgi:hypothetical protein